MADEIVQIEIPFQFNEENRKQFDELIGRYPIKEAAMLPTLHQEGCCHEACCGTRKNRKVILPLLS